jgi:hypothetical protein
MKNIIILVLIGFMLGSCLENSPGFLEPQPAHTKNLKSFPRKLRGTYIMDDQEKLIISKFMIEQLGKESIEMSLAEVDTSPELIIKNNKLVDLESRDEIPVIIKNDSVFGDIAWNDTTFQISNIHVLREYMNYYILNEFTSDSVWKVVRLRILQPGTIEFATIHKNRELEELRKITELHAVEMKNDTISNYLLNPSKEEFILMLSNENLFTDKETYKKK